MDGLNIPLNHILLVSSLLFAIGMLGLMIRRNIIFILMSLEVMLNAAALAFVADCNPPGHMASAKGTNRKLGLAVFDSGHHQ